MRVSRRTLVILGVFAALFLAAVLTRGAGLTARRTAWPGEARIARAVRAWMLPSAYRHLSNPVPDTPESRRAGMEHWADHCATCHGNDGSGRTSLGRGLFPPAPDMRADATQQQTDGALFYAIEEGVPLTGMPAWSNGTSAGERASWELVRFIRHLPALTADEVAEMEALNPKSAGQLEQEHQMEEFLRGGP